LVSRQRIITIATLRFRPYCWNPDMTAKMQVSEIVRAGDLEGLGKVYSQWGGLIPRLDEQIVASAEGWDMDVRSPWRSVLPGMIFMGFTGPISSKLFVTSDRVVLIRTIDPFRELKGELTPLGLPKAAEREASLRRLQTAGARQFCEIWPKYLRIAKMKEHGRPAHAVDLFLLGSNGLQYAVSFWKPQGSEPAVVSLIESRFQR
jgi:hypothetical protein